MPEEGPRKAEVSRAPRKPYTRRPAGSSLDQRSREYRFGQKTRATLLSSLGPGTPTAMQLLIIDRAVHLSILLRQIDDKVTLGTPMPVQVAKVYSSLENGLHRALDRLARTPGAKPRKRKPKVVVPPKVETLQEYIARSDREKAAKHAHAA